MSHRSLRSLGYDLPSGHLNTRAVFYEIVETRETEKGVILVKALRSYLPSLELIPQYFKRS